MASGEVRSVIEALKTELDELASSAEAIAQ
jgi:hypothetical protein